MRFDFDDDSRVESCTRKGYKEGPHAKDKEKGHSRSTHHELQRNFRTVALNSLRQVTQYSAADTAVGTEFDCKVLSASALLRCFLAAVDIVSC